jgi:aminoglycoside phosphotransferase (APT) family kinase protein
MPRLFRPVRRCKAAGDDAVHRHGCRNKFGLTGAGPVDAATLARLDAWLGRHGLVRRSVPVRLPGGLANWNYLVEMDNGPAVLRRPPRGPLAAGASDMAREWRVLSQLHDHFPLAPRAFALCEDTDVLDAPFLLMEWRSGTAIGGALPRTVTAPDAGLRLTRELTARMADLHALDPAAVGLGALGKPEGFYARQLRGWTARAEAVWPTGLPANIAALIAALSPAPDEPGGRLLHMDLKLDNLLVDPARLQATAMIDWDMATRGPADFDLAILISDWVEPGDPAGVLPLAAVPSLLPGWPDRAAVIADYAAAAGRPPGDMVWPVALARLRLAVAWMQLYRKWQRGELTGDGYRGFESLADAIADMALARLQQGRI